MSHAGFKNTHKTTGVKYALEREQDRENVHVEGNNDGILLCC